jgi:CRISPR-associated protein Cas1
MWAEENHLSEKLSAENETMATLYLDRQDLRLRRESKAIALYQGSERRGTLPLSLVERVVVRGRVELDTGVLTELAEHGVGLLVLGGRQGRTRATLLGRPHADARRRVAQYRFHADPAWRRDWSARLVRHKLRGQVRLLRSALAGRPDARRPLLAALDSLDRILTQLRTDPGDLHRLRGLEGAGAAAYFAGYGALFPPALGFSGRNRRPPRDPVNAALSLGYTLLHHEAVLASHSAGLDPLVGFFHDLAYGRESLAADLIEPLRPRLDRWVWELFRERSLRADQFSRDGEACLLSKAGREVFYGAYEDFAAAPRRLLRRYSLGLGKHLAETGA